MSKHIIVALFILGLSAVICVCITVLVLNGYSEEATDLIRAISYLLKAFDDGGKK